MLGKTLALITARGGSKGVPRKNLRLLDGKPLVGWAIETALAVRDRLYGIVVSTEDAEIAEACAKFGAEVPFVRPAELATDDAASLPVMQHAVSFIERRDGVKMDWVLLLQPTSPFRTPRDIAACLEIAAAGECDSVVSIAPISKHPAFAKKIDDNGFLVGFSGEVPEGLRRQDARPPAYMRNGAIYLTRRDVLMEGNSIYGTRVRPYLMPELRSVNIDNELDFVIAQAILDKGWLEKS